jgi:hypothetical protein
MTARLEQQTLEALTNDSEVRARLEQQTLEVASVAPPPARLEQISIEVQSTLAPPARLQQISIEVLSSSTSVTFDPTVAFWGFEPGSEVVERYQWKTDVQTARSGAQVRASLRSEPRVQMEFSITTINPDDMVLADAIITGWQSKAYYMPVWQDRTQFETGLPSGTTQIATPLQGLAYTDGVLIAFWTSASDYQVVQVFDADFENDVLTLAQPLNRSWPAGVFMAPVRRAWLLPEASAARFTGASLEARLVFDLEAPVPIEREEWDFYDGGPWEADGLALFPHRPNWSQSPRITYERRLDQLGDGTNVPWRRDVSGRGWITRSHQHTATSRAEINKLLSWVAQRRGRARAYLAPVWDMSIEVTRSNTDTSAALYVKTRGYEQFLDAIKGRGYIALRDASGWIVRRITKAENASDTEDMLTLSAPIGRAGTPGGWLDVVLCEPAHLGSDVFEVLWWNRDTADVIISHQQVIA